MDALDKINNLPINPLLEQATSTLAQSEKTMQHVQTTLDNLNKITSSQSMQQLPADMQTTLRELNRSMQGFQPALRPTIRWWPICSVWIRCCVSCSRF